MRFVVMDLFLRVEVVCVPVGRKTFSWFFSFNTYCLDGLRKNGEVPVNQLHDKEQEKQCRCIWRL